MFQKLSSFSVNALTKEQMRSIKGAMATVKCNCANGKSWSGIIHTSQDAKIFSYYNCGSGVQFKCWHLGPDGKPI